MVCIIGTLQKKSFGVNVALIYPVVVICETSIIEGFQLPIIFSREIVGNTIKS